MAVLDASTLEFTSRLAGRLAVADAGQQIGDGIGHAHCVTAPYQLDFTTPGIFAVDATSRSLLRPGRTCGTRHASGP
jgi:hypothetical protein